MVNNSQRITIVLKENKMKTRNLIPLFALLFGSVGCASNFMQTARTNGEGNFQFGVEPLT